VDGRLLVWDQGFGLWQGEELEHLDLGALRPAPIPGVTWTNTVAAALSFKGQTILPWRTDGQIRYDELLGVTLEPGVELVVGDDPGHTSPALGEVRRVYTSARPSETLGRIQVSLRDETIAVMTDLESGRVLLEVDARTLGLVDVSDLWRAFYLGRIPGPNGGAVLEGDSVAAFSPLTTLRVLHGPSPDYVVMGPEILAFSFMEDESTGDYRSWVDVWASTDGEAWSLRGSALVGEERITSLSLLPALSDPGTGRLVAGARLESELREVIATSTDGVVWVPAFDVPSCCQDAFDAVPLGGDVLVAGAYPDLFVSTDGGRRWEAIERVPGVGALVDSGGGSLGFLHSRESDTVYFPEISGDERVLWTLTFEATS
jgi:hypothetical protein